MDAGAEPPGTKQFKANLPVSIFRFLEEQAGRFASSINSEIVRAVRERMDRIHTGPKDGDDGNSPSPTGPRE